MIVFCEDCGRKNSIGPGAIQDGIIDFHCSICQYHNRYPCTHKQQQNPAAELTRVLDSLASHKAIKGYYIFHPAKGVLYRRMPSSLTGEDLAAMGKSLAGSYQTGRKLFSDIRNVRMTLQKYEIWLMHICSHFFLILVNESSGMDDSFNRRLDDHLLLLEKMIVNQNAQI